MDLSDETESLVFIKISFNRKETTLKTDISNGILIHTQIHIHTEQPSHFDKEININIKLLKLNK